MASPFFRSSKHMKLLLFLLLPTLFIVHIISISTPHWLHNKSYINSGFVVEKQQEIGLFKTCAVNVRESLSACQTINNPPNWLKAVRGLMILSTISILLAILFCLLITFTDSIKHPVGEKLLGSDLGIASLFTTISWIVYVSEVGEGRKFVNACFGLAIVSSLLSVISSLVSFTSPPMKEKIYSKKSTHHSQQISVQNSNSGVIMFPHNYQQPYESQRVINQSAHDSPEIYGHPYPFSSNRGYINDTTVNSQA